jgi:hypothetical protein
MITLERRRAAGGFIVGGREYGLAEFRSAAHAQYVLACLQRVAWRRLAMRAARQGRPVSWREIIRALERRGVLLPLLAGLYVERRREHARLWTSAGAVETCERFAAADLLGDDRLLLARLALAGFQHFANHSVRIRALACRPAADVVFHFPLPALRGRLL